MIIAVKSGGLGFDISYSPPQQKKQIMGE